MRALGLAVLSVSLLACVTPEAAITTCGEVRLDRPLLVLEQDPLTGSGLGLIDEGGCFLEVPDASLSSNGILATAGERVFFVDQTRGVLDPINTKTLGLSGDPVAAFAPGKDPTEPNPHGVDVDVDGNLWIARYGMGSLAVVSPAGKILATVDLSDLDPDGLPDMEAVHIEGDRVFVAIERLDFNADGNGLVLPRGPGTIVAIDRVTRARTGTFSLAGRNPFGRFTPMDAAGTRYAIATAGRSFFTDAEDGIDVVDFAQGTATQLIGEVELGGTVSEVLIAGPTEGYAIVLGDGEKSPTSLVRFDPSMQQPVQVLDAAPLFLHAGLAIDGGLVLVGDHTVKGSGILAFDRATRAPSGRITAHRLPPWSLHTTP
ncbi:MAG: SMP-30/gluconolactonase/LRE family protein [Byssovorax sp.]